MTPIDKAMADILYILGHMNTDQDQKIERVLRNLVTEVTAPLKPPF